MKKFIALLLLVSLLACIVFFRSLLVYGYEQARGQLTIMVNARDLDKVFADPSVADSIKLKLRLIESVKKFAEDSLGIHPSKNYTTYYQQKNESLMLVLTACKPYSFEAYKWHFPVIGEFSYKGFFNLSRAKNERDLLRQQGFDTGLGGVSGWSTLGWLRDPVISSMLRKPDGELAELIIHELTHGTLYVKNDVEFNENLASFIGEKGAQHFLHIHYGEASPQLQEYLAGLDDDRMIREHMLRGYLMLDSLYKSMPTATDTSYKASQKAAIINQIFMNVDTLPLKNTGFKVNVIERRHKVNNTYFMSFKRYYGDEGSLEKTYIKSYDGNLKTMLEAMKLKYPSL